MRQGHGRAIGHRRVTAWLAWMATGWPVTAQPAFDEVAETAWRMIGSPLFRGDEKALGADYLEAIVAGDDPTAGHLRAMLRPDLRRLRAMAGDGRLGPALAEVLNRLIESPTPWPEEAGATDPPRSSLVLPRAERPRAVACLQMRRRLGLDERADARFGRWQPPIYLGLRRQGWPTVHRFLSSAGLVELEQATGRIVRFRRYRLPPSTGRVSRSEAERRGRAWLTEHGWSLDGWVVTPESARESDAPRSGHRFRWRRPPVGDLMPPALVRLELDAAGRVIDLERRDRTVAERPRVTRAAAVWAARAALGSAARLLAATCHVLYDEADRPLFRWRVELRKRLHSVQVIIDGETGRVIARSDEPSPPELSGLRLRRELRDVAHQFSRAELVTPEPRADGGWGIGFSDGRAEPWVIGGLHADDPRWGERLREALDRGAVMGDPRHDCECIPDLFLRLVGGEPEATWTARFFGGILEFYARTAWPLDPLDEIDLPAQRLVLTFSISPELTRAFIETIHPVPRRLFEHHLPEPGRTSARADDELPVAVLGAVQARATLAWPAGAWLGVVGLAAWRLARARRRPEGPAGVRRVGANPPAYGSGSMDPVKVGVIGCGAIAGKYLENSKLFAAFDVVGVADLRVDAAKARAEEYGIPWHGTPDELLARDDVEMVVILTPHKAHGPVGLAALQAGKSPYLEKPMAVYRDEGREMLRLAAAGGLRVGAAPDTFFGGAWQTARRLIDDGAIGRPTAAMANLHAFKAPNPQPPAGDGYVSFYRTDFYEFGVTWSFDRGPYYLHALLHLLGPVVRVTGSAREFWSDQPGLAEVVRTPTHFAGVLDFACGAVGTFLVTSDVHATGLPHIEVYGTEGSLRCIDPNNFGGPILLRRADSSELVEVDCPFGYRGNSRGVGIADMAVGLRHGRPHRADGAMGYHVIDIIHALHEASAEGRHITLESTCAQPAPLPLGLADWAIDD